MSHMQQKFFKKLLYSGLPHIQGPCPLPPVLVGAQGPHLLPPALSGPSPVGPSPPPSAACSVKVIVVSERRLHRQFSVFLSFLAAASDVAVHLPLCDTLALLGSIAPHLLAFSPTPLAFPFLASFARFPHFLDFLLLELSGAQYFFFFPFRIFLFIEA